MSKTKFIKRSATLGALAKEYCITVRTLLCMIEPFTELKKEIDLQTEKNTSKGAKLLPPRIVELIYTALGEP